MSTIVTDSKNYSDIAAAIRDKLGENKNFKPAEMAAAIEAIKTGAENVVEFTAPKGRMKGDVDGDGFVTFNTNFSTDTSTDAGKLYAHMTATAIITDEIALWCADMNGDGLVNGNDLQGIMNYCNNGYFSKMTDYYGNWVYTENVQDKTSYFYRDIPVAGMTANSTAILLVSNYEDCFIGIECLEGVARIKAKRLPLADTDCLLVWEADGSKWKAVVNLQVLTATANGTYTPASGVDGYSSVTVAIPAYNGSVRDV